MKLWLPDSLVIEILRSDALMDKTEQIVVESVTQAAVDEAEPFVTNLLSALIADG